MNLLAYTSAKQGYSGQIAANMGKTIFLQLVLIIGSTMLTFTLLYGTPFTSKACAVGATPITAGGGGGGEAAGPEAAESSCDPLYMESLEKRAWLEGEREVIQNQNYIVKGDSVLEYTCYDQALINVTAGPIAAIFSDEALGVQAPPPMIAQILPSVHLHSANYLDSNFGHEFGGGTWVGSGGAAPYANSSDPCAVMATVWQLAKDENFIADPAIDGFYSFVEYMEMEDPRIYPEPYAGPEIPWEDSILVAQNIEAIGQRPPVDLGAGYEFRNPLLEDFVELIRPRLIPGACTAVVGTGVTVLTTPAAQDGYLDGICTNPGCTFVVYEAGDGVCVP